MREQDMRCGTRPLEKYLWELLLGLILGASSGAQELRAQPEEVRIRSLVIADSGGTVRPKDLLGSGGIVLRDALPGQFWARLPRPVGDVNGDSFSDLTVFWGAVGDVVFQELFLIMVEPNLLNVSIARTSPSSQVASSW